MGSGKSAVAKLFCDNGFVLVDADKVAREVVEKGSETLELLVQKFGDDVLNSDGSLNRKTLSQKAFSKKEGTALLNSITHPAILKLVKDKIDTFLSSGYDKVIYDAPLLFESGSDKFCDKIVCVIATKEMRKARVKKRDGMAENEIEKRFSAQHEDSFYTQKSDYVIYNDSTLDMLKSKAEEVIAQINEVKNATTF